MKKNNLLEAFNIKQRTTYKAVEDYNTFKDKKLLDSFRVKILQNIADKGLIDVNHEIINDEIEIVTYGYDLDNNERNYLLNLIDGEINGYGPITELLKDNNITEIMVNSPSDIFIEVDGSIIKDESVSFINNDHILRTIEKLIEPSGAVIDAYNPIIDTTISDGSRINAIIPPISKNPVMTIRKFKKEISDMDTLIGNGTLTPYMARFLKCCVEARLNILISGYGNSGKTTLLNILSTFIPENERVIAIEDINELDLNNDNIISLTPTKEIKIKDLVNNSIRMRPDRLIIGELKGEETSSVLQAMNTGNEGSLATIYAGSSKDAIKKIESLIYLDSKDLSMDAVRNYIINSIDIVVHIQKLRDGKKKITNISEVNNIIDNEIKLKDIFAFTKTKLSENGNISGEFILYNTIPKCLTKIKNAGINDLDDMFKR